MHKEYLNEIWKDIKGYKGLYQVSNFGRVRSMDRIDFSGHKLKGKIMKLNKESRGYLTIFLCKNGVRTHHFVHRLVAEAFIHNPHNLHYVNHKDEDKTNNIVWINDGGTVDIENSNLEWCTQKYNCNYGNRNNKISISKINGKKSKAVLQFSINYELIKEWPSLMEIKRCLEFSPSNISFCCNNKLKTAYGYIWKFKS